MKRSTAMFRMLRLLVCVNLVEVGVTFKYRSVIGVCKDPDPCVPIGCSKGGEKRRSANEVADVIPANYQDRGDVIQDGGAMN